MSLARLAQKSFQAAQSVADAVRQAFRGRLSATQTGNTLATTQVQGLAGETLQEVEQMQQFGFTSHAPAGSEVIVLPLGGDTTHGIVIASEHGSFRLKNLQGGEVAVYDQSGSSVVLRQGRLIEMDCDNLIIRAKQKVLIDSPLVEASEQVLAKGQITGQNGLAISGGEGGDAVRIEGSLKTTGDVVAGDISVQQHTHPGDSGGTTGAAQ
jgi:bacteriophage Mu gp45 protein|nr:MAG TPA: baseplate assembly protein V [Caudoviricetes sp.]